MTAGLVIYFCFYIAVALYLVILGCFMLTRRKNPCSTHGEIVVKQRMTCTVGVLMLVWATAWLIYLPAMLHGCGKDHPVYELLFLTALLLDTPMIYQVMLAIVQRKSDVVRETGVIVLPFLILTAWYIVMPEGGNTRLPCHIAAILSISLIIFFLVRYVSEYRLYIQRVRSEYSETSGREIIWSWSCFAGFAIQLMIFVLYSYLWTPWLEIVYMVLIVVNATYLCHCTYKQKPIDYDVVDDVKPDPSKEVKIEEKAFYALIEQRLESLCEKKLLFLEPDLTRETLCLRLNIGRTYLGMYLHSRGLTFYQYINTLRVEYAIKLMEENPEMPIREVSELSGFRSQTTFRKVFKEVMGCLPSEIRKSNQ